MSAHPLNKTWVKQHEKLLPATYKKAIITAVNIQNATADVYYVGNPQTTIRSLPLSKQITPSSVKVRMRCKVDLFDEKNSSDDVIAYCY